MFQKWLMRSSIALVLLALGACATNVQRYTNVPTARVVAGSDVIRSVSVTLSASGQSDWAQNTQFDKNTLLTHVEQVLQAQRIYAPNSGGQDTLEVQITAIRVRSTFNAVMWGFMAGSDNLRGDVYLRDPSGKLLNHFSVYASNALGGIAGGAQSVRWGWLYNKFAQLVAQNLTS